MVRLRNEGNTRVELKTKSRLGGFLFRDFIEYGYKQHRCKCDTWQRPWQEKYETEFQLLPINQELVEDWTRLVAKEGSLVYLEPKEEAIYGLYGRGERLGSFVDNGIPNSSHKRIEVVVGCETPDPNDKKGPKDMIKIASPTPIYDFVPYGIDVNGVSMHLDSGRISIGVRNGTFDEIDDPATDEIHLEVRDRGIL